jgi:hypothetical protein
MTGYRWMHVRTCDSLHVPLQRTLVVTDQRVLFLWRKYNTTLCTFSREESFTLDDLKVTTDTTTCTMLYCVHGMHVSAERIYLPLFLPLAQLPVCFLEPKGVQVDTEIQNLWPPLEAPTAPDPSGHWPTLLCTCSVIF